jgi:hypothetical protein
VTRLAERPVQAHHVDAAEFMNLMTVGGSSAIPDGSRPGLCGVADLIALTFA